jgi:hypothetical protein
VISAYPSSSTPRSCRIKIHVTSPFGGDGSSVDLLPAKNEKPFTSSVERFLLYVTCNCSITDADRGDSSRNRPLRSDLRDPGRH